MGDGINDAPSLHSADVGISVPSAVDVARDAADIILVEPGLAVLHRGILEGRKASGNAMKYLLMATSSNFGNMLSMAAASVFLPFLPMLPTQVLLNNFMYDLSQVTIPTDNVDDDYVRLPALGHEAGSRFHAVHRADQFDLRFSDVLRFASRDAGERARIPNWLVRGIACHADAVAAGYSHDGKSISQPSEQASFVDDAIYRRAGRDFTVYSGRRRDGVHTSSSDLLCFSCVRYVGVLGNGGNWKTTFGGTAHQNSAGNFRLNFQPGICVTIKVW